MSVKFNTEDQSQGKDDMSDLWVTLYTLIIHTLMWTLNEKLKKNLVQSKYIKQA